MSDYEFTVIDRFLRYIQIDTQADETSSSCPSSAKQKDLGQLLAAELLELGLGDASMDDNGYVYATIPSTTDKDVPVIAFLAHQDTSPEAPGANVKPIFHDYKGGDIVLPGDTSIVIKADENPALEKLIGQQIITSDGTTLLGADDKAGIAEIMDMTAYLLAHPEIKHGEIRVVFTVDEEIGRGVDHLNRERVGAKAAYTFDGTVAGEYETETFSADMATVTCTGVNVHPGFAKDKMTNAVKMMAAFIDKLPDDSFSPETTEGKEQFVHPYTLEGGVPETTCKILLRSFVTADLAKQAEYLRGIAAEVQGMYPAGKVAVDVVSQYRNMKDDLDKRPEVADIAAEAIRRVGLEPHSEAIRGGTDGSRLTAEGLPTPNLFAGGMLFHSCYEYVSPETMKKAVMVGVEISKLWEERA